MLITVHPQMLDVMSMCQFLIMTSDLLAVVARAGGDMAYDWMRYLVTRYEPSDGPQTQMVGFMRSLFGDRMLRIRCSRALRSQTQDYKADALRSEPGSVYAPTYDRAIESLESVNSEIENHIRAAWRR